MKVLVTGAFGNIGSHTVDALLALGGHQVRAMAHTATPTRPRFPAQVEVVRADLCDPASLEAAVHGVDVVIHLGFVIPPAALDHPDLAERTNVGGTRNLLDAVAQHAPQARFYFASSLDVYGPTGDAPPPRRVGDRVVATDAYTRHKLECEEMVRSSGLTWAIGRYADVPPLMLRSPVPIMFEIPIDQRIEALHPRDAGFATARAATSSVAWGKVWNLGGGPSCQVTYGEYLTKLLGAMGMGGALPAAAFTTKPYCTDWLDTAESQSAFGYQEHTFDDIVADIAALLGWKKPFTPLARPFVRRRLLSLSPYLREARQSHKRVGDAGPVRRGVRRATAPMTRTRAFRSVAPRVLPAVERSVEWLTRGHYTLSEAMVPALVLHTTGARTGLARDVDLMYIPDGPGRAIVAGTNFARDTHPAWTGNLRAHPDAAITVRGGRTIPVHATEIGDDEREAVWERIESQWPGYRAYERDSGRVVRLFRLQAVRRPEGGPKRP